MQRNDVCDIGIRRLLTERYGKYETCAKNKRLYPYEGATVVAGEGVGLASVCRPTEVDVTSASLRSNVLLTSISATRFTVSRASKPGRASLVTDELKPSPALDGATEAVCVTTMVAGFCLLPLAA
jgi:hypothetical protein